ncbi:MAG: flavin-containing monooxygenase [Chloroflexota bacterium]
MAEDVLVIGAGPAGIACAYFLQEAGIHYRVVDRAQEIASTWNSLYPSLRLNTTRFFSHLPGKRFPLRYGLFPTGKQYHRYLEDYVREHNFNIHLGVTVHEIKPEDGGWRVESSEGSTWYSCVISATGRFGRRWLPDIPGMNDFRGRLIHAQDYLGPEPYAGKRVMVVGNGPSGVDIATELGRDPNVVHPVLLSQRTGVVLRPRYPMGLPKHAWVIIGETLPKRIGQRLIDHITSIRFENLDRVGIKTPRTEAESSAAGGTRGRELIDVVKAGRVRCVDGPVRFYPEAVRLQDGACVTVDAVIMGTGYKPVIDRYFKLPFERDNQGWPMRVEGDPDRQDTGQRQVAGYPGLYLVGVFYTGKGAMYNFNVEARQAVEEIQTRLAELRRTHPDALAN